MMNDLDGMKFMDMGVLVVIQLGSRMLGITRDQFLQLATSGPEQRKKLTAQWLSESIDQ